MMKSKVRNIFTECLLKYNDTWWVSCCVKMNGTSLMRCYPQAGVMSEAAAV